jgi:uncharacterized protein involved in outer membrane biogenesis
MKKILIRSVIVLVVLVIAALVALSIFLDDAIKKGIETVGPQLTRVSIKLDSVSLSVLSGSGEIKGLEVGNPEGYKSTNAMTLGHASVSVVPRSLLADKIVIRHIRVEAPEITIEGSPKNNNLTKIMENVQAASGSSGTEPATPAEAGGSTKKLQVDEFLLKDAKVTYIVAGQTFKLTVPEVKLTGLGQGPDGITSAELTNLALSKLSEELIPILTEQANKIGKQAVDSALERASRSLGDLLQKK